MFVCMKVLLNFTAKIHLLHIIAHSTIHNCVPLCSRSHYFTPQGRYQFVLFYFSQLKSVHVFHTNGEGGLCSQKTPGQVLLKSVMSHSQLEFREGVGPYVTQMDEHWALVSALCVVELCQVLEGQYQSKDEAVEERIRELAVINCCPQDLSSSFCHGRENGHRRLRSVLLQSLRLDPIWKNPAVDSDSSHLSTLQIAHWQILHAFNLRLRLSTIGITSHHLSIYPVQVPYA